MRTTPAHVRRLSVVAAAACGLVALSACSGGSSTDATSSATLSTTSPTVPSTTSSSAPSASRSVLSTGSSSKSASSSSSKSAKSSKSSSSSSAKKSKSTKATPKPDPVGACKTANTKSNAAIGQWNTAVNSQSKTKLDAAAHNFETTATALRKLPSKAQQKGFTTRVKAVANDLDAMAKNRFDGKTVDPSAYNSDSEKLRSYCQNVLTSQ